MGTRLAIFKWRQTEASLILCAVRWHLRYSLSLRDVEELLEERGLHVDHTTVWRWVRDYGPELEQRLRQHFKPTNKSWRVDETGSLGEHGTEAALGPLQHTVYGESQRPQTTSRLEASRHPPNRLSLRLRLWGEG